MYGAGCDEEHLIRASAVRALAIFALFPSLRDDICYMENTLEAIIRCLVDGNLETRIKGSWALGNITNALLLNRYRKYALSIL